MGGGLRSRNNVVRRSRARSERLTSTLPGAVVRCLSHASNQAFLRDISEVSEEDIQERWVLDEAKALSSQYYDSISGIDGSLGLDSIKSKEQLHKKLKQQLHQELFTFDATVKIYREMVCSLTDLGLAASLKPEQRMLVHWLVASAHSFSHVTPQRLTVFVVFPPPQGTSRFRRQLSASTRASAKTSRRRTGRRTAST